MFSADNDALQSQYTEFEKHDSICQRGIPCSRHDNMLIPQLEISVIWWNPFIKFISLNTYLRSWEGVEETLPSLYSTLHLWENYNLYLFTCFGTGLMILGKSICFPLHPADETDHHCTTHSMSQWYQSLSCAFGALLLIHWEDSHRYLCVIYLFSV